MAEIVFFTVLAGIWVVADIFEKIHNEENEE